LYVLKLVFKIIELVEFI